MPSSKYKKLFFLVVSLSIIALSLYGLGRLYYYVTDGFTIGNIQSDLQFDPRWEATPSLDHPNEKLVGTILDQKFTYLAKGCQAYVFQSADGRYVLKFFKYQRYRIQPWLTAFSFLPYADSYFTKKLIKKNLKRESFFLSWKIAYQDLKGESGLVFLHLNKTNHLNKVITIVDKMGVTHQVDADKMEFLIQKKASMLGPYLLELKTKGDLSSAQQLVDRILNLVLSEYERGLGDNDHALMQNTGVFEGEPIHIDVGQFVYNEEFKRPELYKQELFSKFYRFHQWLNKEYPQLGQYLTLRMREIIGPQIEGMQPIFKPHEN